MVEAPLQFRDRQQLDRYYTPRLRTPLPPPPPKDAVRQTFTERWARFLFEDGMKLREIMLLLVQAALIKADGNKSVAAKYLGMSRTGLYKTMDYLSEPEAKEEESEIEDD